MEHEVQETIEKDEIVWKNVKLFINTLAENEHTYIKKEYKIRDKKNLITL